MQEVAKHNATVMELFLKACFQELVKRVEPISKSTEEHCAQEHNTALIHPICKCEHIKIYVQQLGIQA